jgi:hypothetical protein
MSWLEFIVQITSALAWPALAGGAIVLLRKQIKSAADRLVARVGAIQHLKAAGVAIDFRDEVEQLAKDTEELESEAPKALPAGEPKDVVLPPETAEERLTKYQQLAALDPRAAILLPFADMEGAIRQRFHALYPQERRGVSFLRILDTLQADRKLDPEIADALRRMSKIRNEAAHERTELDVDVANVFLESVGNVLGYLLLFGFFDDPDPTT